MYEYQILMNSNSEKNISTASGEAFYTKDGKALRALDPNWQQYTTLHQWNESNSNNSPSETSENDYQNDH